MLGEGFAFDNRSGSEKKEKALPSTTEAAARKKEKALPSTTEAAVMECNTSENVIKKFGGIL